MIAYPIPRCDLAVFNKFGQGGWMWMFDAPMEYHQLAAVLASQKKLTFQGLDAIKWTYTVMLFGPTNGSATIINFIHDINSIWKELAKKQCLTIDDNTNTCIIMDDIVSWSGSFKRSLAYMQCQLIVWRAYNLSLKLGKSQFFPCSFEFVGIDVCSDGNRPAKSKHQLLKTWPAPELVCNVAKNLALCNFIHNLFLTLKYVLPPCAVLPNRKILMLLGRTGRLRHRQPGRIWKAPSCLTRALGALIIANYSCCIPISLV